jgi:hypothetical protein
MVCNRTVNGVKIIAGQGFKRPQTVSITVQYFILLSNIDRLGIILKGRAIYLVNQKWFDIYCAIWKMLQCCALSLQSPSKARAVNIFGNE